MESRHIRILNNMASVGGSVDSVISSDTMSSVSLRERYSWFFSGQKKYSVSPKMPRSGAQSQVFHAPAIFMNSLITGTRTTHLLWNYNSSSLIALF